MAEIFSDGNLTWIGGMDTSRNPSDIGKNQYVKAVNMVIAPSQGALSVRPGFHYCKLDFDSKQTKSIYENGGIQAEGWFESNNKIFIIVVVSGYVLRFTRVSIRRFYVENVNSNDQNDVTLAKAWVNTIPNGCIVNNGRNNGLYVTSDSQRRLNPSNQEFGPGQMGVYVQNRYFQVDDSGRRILASDFLNPIKFTREDTNIFGFACPDEDELITAIGKQKSILNYAEGGNLIWSSAKDIYSADVRGTRSDWSDLGTRVGKVTETIPGFSAISSYSFESFNSNIYFRSKQYGVANIKQSEYQFVNYDTLTNESVEASYYLNQDTDWLLDRCYTRSCNSRLFTTVAPERTPEGYCYWNGLISFNPAAMYSGSSQIQRRFESVFTGVRPWCVTVTKATNEKDELFVHSYDKDGINRMYVMDESTNYDTNSSFTRVEIKSFIETRGYNHEQPFLLKNYESNFYRLRKLERSVNVKAFCRSDATGEWTSIGEYDHLVCRVTMTNGLFDPSPNKPQTRNMIHMRTPKFSQCSRNPDKGFFVQYRLEFEGPAELESIGVVANVSNPDKTIYQKESECIVLSYTFRPNYYYLIQDYASDIESSNTSSEGC